MRIEQFDRVVYENNPLAEVICQLRFPRVDETTTQFREKLTVQLVDLGYSAISEEESIEFVHRVVVGEPPADAEVSFPKTKISHFSTADGFWRASISNQFVSLTCQRYTAWVDFLPRMLTVARLFGDAAPSASPVRLGLRYKDVVEREALGLDGVPWHELIQPFLLGAMTPSALADGQYPTEVDFLGFATNSLIRLEKGSMLLQSALLTSTDRQRRAFLIDADFFIEGDEMPTSLLSSEGALRENLALLHQNAGALFRRGIKERLHRALRPS